MIISSLKTIAIYLLSNTVSAVLIIVPLLVVLAYYTLAERKIMATLQRRFGPNVQGEWGLLQPLLDGIKLLTSEIIIPTRATIGFYIAAPALAVALSFSFWAVLPLSYSSAYKTGSFSLLFVLIISSLNVYSIVLAGWASNSRYALLGGLRAIAQMISYELALGTLLLIVISITGTTSLTKIVYYQQIAGWLQWPMFLVANMGFIVLLMETNRVPFDLSEAESELVAGYHVEYSSIFFAMFFLGEYCSMLAMCTFWAILFWGGWTPIVYLGISWIPSSLILILKASVLWVFFIVVRALVPRYRFDQVIFLGWAAFLPVFLGFLVFILGFLKFFSANLAISDIFLYSDQNRLSYGRPFLSSWIECKFEDGQCHKVIAFRPHNSPLDLNIITDTVDVGSYADGIACSDYNKFGWEAAKSHPLNRLRNRTMSGAMKILYEGDKIK